LQHHLWRSQRVLTTTRPDVRTTIEEDVRTRIAELVLTSPLTRTAETGRLLMGIVRLLTAAVSLLMKDHTGPRIARGPNVLTRVGAEAWTWTRENIHRKKGTSLFLHVTELIKVTFDWKAD
jgi:hypothetical protein